MSRTLAREAIEELMAELGIGQAAWAIEGKRVFCVNRAGERKIISLELQIGEGESGAIARIARAIQPEPVFLDI